MPLAPEMSTYPESQNTFLALHIVSNLLNQMVKSVIQVNPKICRPLYRLPHPSICPFWGLPKPPKFLDF